jgi:hypothetical protein
MFVIFNDPNLLTKSWESIRSHTPVVRTVGVNAVARNDGAVVLGCSYVVVFAAA